MMGYRKAAAALHGLSSGDREWILSELSAEDGRHVKKYLEELNELGFAEDVLSDEVPVFAQRPARTANDRSSATLRMATAAEIFAVVETESPVLVGRLLAMRDWRWSDELVRMFPPMRQDQIRAAMNGRTPAAPALDKFLADAVAMRLKGNAGGVLRIADGWLVRFSSMFSGVARSWSR